MRNETRTAILFEDAHFIAVDKPAGLLVHPSHIDAQNADTLITRLAEQTGQRCAPVHRLDRATSGVMVLAKHADAARALSATWATGVRKSYHAVVRGHLRAATRLEHPVRDRDSGVRRDAITRFAPLAEVEINEHVDRYPTTRYALIEAEPITGRRHQIRQHLKHLNHPILGDTSYGKSVHNRYIATRFNAQRLLLMAKQLSFRHPFNGDLVCLDASPDAAFQRVLDGLPWRPTETA
ncbi:MAG: pseudouridine synthase [Pseudomonadota bacterium]